MVKINDNIPTIIASTITMVLSIILLSFAGITKNLILMPIGLSFERYTNISFGYLFLSLILMALSVAIICIHSIKAKDIDFSILITPSIASIFILAIAKISLLSIFLSLGLILGVFLALYISFNDKEEYKKISAYKISTHAASKLFLILTVIIACGVYTVLDSDSSYVDTTINDILQTTVGITKDDLTNLEDTIKEQQRQASYAYIDGMGQIYLETLKTTGNLSETDRTKCINSFQDNLETLDASAKEQIDAQLESQELSLDTEKTEMITSLLEMIEKTYPILTAFTILAILSTINSVILVPLAGIFSWLIWRNTRKPPKEEEMENYLSHNSELNK
ncbi:MAG: hypothetical protein KAI53_00505 [Candidatus Aenigmarchaeota archaeon]|nr:hypothetical protein [Candidatus Aenigmarchaeota archaeon]